MNVPHPSDIRRLAPLRRAIATHGEMAYNIYFCAMERLCEEEFLYLSDYNVMATELHVKNSIVKSVIEDFGLFTFTEDGKRFYSEVVKEQIAEIKRAYKARAEAGRLGGLAKAKKLKQSSSNAKAMVKQSQSDATGISKDINNNISSTKEDTSKPKGSKTDNKLSALGNAHARARVIFVSFYSEVCGQSYYFTAKDAGQLRNLLRAITHNLKESGKPTDDDSVLDKFKNYIRYAYDNNKWIREHFSITNLSSQYNEIRSSLTGKDNGRKPIRPEQLHVEKDPRKFDDGFK